jgi:ribosomal protein L40E
VADERRLDGNAIGGVLFELFGAEMTDVPGVCASCGARAQMAATDVYIHAPGIVVRCRHCESVLLRIVRGRDRSWLDLSGLGSIELSRGEPS